MASGKRLPGEKFEDYRNRLKKSAADLKQYLNGKMVWQSSILVPDPRVDQNALPDDQKHLVKIRQNGTYIKPMEGAKK